MGREKDKARDRRLKKIQHARHQQGLQTGLIAAGVVVACAFAFILTHGGNKQQSSVAQAPPAPSIDQPLKPPPAPETAPPPTREEQENDLLAGIEPRPPEPASDHGPAAEPPKEPAPPADEGGKTAEPPKQPGADAPNQPGGEPPKQPGGEPPSPGGQTAEPPTPSPPPEGGEPGTQIEKKKEPPKPPAGPPPGFGAGKNWPKPSPQHVKSIEHGVAIIPPPDWRSIPPPKEYRGEFVLQEEAVQVYSFKDKRDMDPDNYEVSMKVWIVAQAKDPEEAFAKWAKAEQYKVAGVKFQPFKVGPWEARHTVFATDRMRELIEQDPPPDPAFNKDVTVIFESGRAGIVEFTSGVRYGKKKADIFLRSARSFLFLSSENVAKEKSKSDGSTELPKGWTAYCTAHYEIQYNCDKPFADEIGRHLELILKEYERRFPMPEVLEAMKGTGKQRRFTVKVFKTYEEFDAYAHQNGVGGAAAYFSPSQDELVCYRTTEQGKKKTFHIIYHEASHQYMHVYFGYEVDIPIWVDEGVAEYFYGGELQPNGGFRIEENKDRLPDIKEAIRIGKSVPVGDIMKYTQPQYYSNAGVCYAEGWSLAYFFWQAKDKKYAGRLERFYETLKASQDTAKANQEAFGDLDMKQLEEDWRKFVLGL